MNQDLQSNLKLREEGLIVLGINRENGDYIGIPDGENEIKPGDILITYGRTQSVAQIDERKAGTRGAGFVPRCIITDLMVFAKDI